jgi:hypothetical protein
MLHRSRITLAGLLTFFVGIVPLAGGPTSAFAATLNVCQHCTYTTIQDALSHAGNGDTIRVSRGKYVGPITILKSVKLNGAGAGSTVIRGHGSGPVMVVGVLNASTGPTVSITGITVTGGRNTSYPDSFEPYGGGIWAHVGATVTINHSLITGNSVRSLGSEPCGGGNMCSFAGAAGIVNLGAMTLNNTTVSNNSALDLNATGDYNHAQGGGVSSAGAGSTLIVSGSTVTGNSAKVSSTIGWTHDDAMGAFGGGIDASGPLKILNSTVSANKVAITDTGMQQTGSMYELGGGLQIGGATTIIGSRINGNTVTMTSYSGIVSSGAGGISQGGGSLLLVNSEVSHNSARCTITSTRKSAGASTDSGAIEINGVLTIKRSQFIGNSLKSTAPAAVGNGGSTTGTAAFLNASPSPVTMTGIIVRGNTAVATTVSGTARSGDTIGSGGVLTLTRSTVAGNTSRASSSTGTATVQGGGITNGGPLTLRSTTVTKNVGVAYGHAGKAQGGGIWNVDIGNGPPKLTLIGSAVTYNVLTANNPKITVQGGGLYTTAHVTLTKSIIAHNVPDQCYGC